MSEQKLEPNCKKLRSRNQVCDGAREKKKKKDVGGREFEFLWDFVEGIEVFFADIQTNISEWNEDMCAANTYGRPQ